MGRHAASETSTVSPPRSNSETLRDAHVYIGEQIYIDEVAAAHPSVSPLFPSSLSASTPSPTKAPTPAPSKVAKPLAPAHLDAKPLISKPASGKPLAAPPPTGPLRVADLVARYSEIGPGSAEQHPGPKNPGPKNPASRGRRSAPRSRAESGTWVSAADLIARHRELTAPPAPSSAAASSAAASSAASPSPATTAQSLPALRPAPSIRVAIRPVLTVAAIIAAIGLIEAPNLISASPSPSSTHNASGAPAADAVADRAAAGAVATPGSAVLGDPPHTVQRVSRAVRHAFTVSASHVPAMKPGQTVPGTWVLPNNGPYTSCFCERWGSFHGGIDLAGKLGSPILAVGDGTVIAAGPASGFGNWVVIQHSNGDVSIYGHMQFFFVHKGEKVKAGQKIAVVGDEGFSTGPHLHFEVHKGGLAGPKINPIPWLKARGIIIGPLNRNG